jgi:hypothetical protein
VSTGPGSDKGKGKAAPQIILSDTEVSSEEDDIPLQRRTRSFHSGGFTINRPQLSRQQAPGVATAPQADPRVVVSTTPGGSDDDGSTTTAREASMAASAEKAAEVRMAEEAATAKVAEEATTAKAAEEAMAKVTVDEAMMKTADQGAAGAKATVESVGSGPAPLLPQRWESIERLRWVAPLLLPSGSAAPGSPSMQSICVVAFLFSVICTIFDWNLCCSARLPLV